MFQSSRAVLGFRVRGETNVNKKAIYFEIT
jgi:hypothetical protein